ncbi:MAG: helix-turn-helix domain-containing protein, partial [Flavobacterium sp.]
WATTQSETMDQLLAPASKFIQQLQKLFAAETVDLHHILERINAAFDYFWKPMDALVESLLYKLQETQHSKKAKGFFEELSQLEALQTKAVLQLMKAQLLVQTVVAGEAISKEKLTSTAIKSYLKDKTEKVKAAYQETHTDLLEETTETTRYSAKSKASKTKKKSTVEETYELWIAKKSITEIALLRMLTKETVWLHLTKLIAEKKIDIHSVLTQEKVTALAQAFYGYQEESLGPLKEKHGDTFTWEELRMFKASSNS